MHIMINQTELIYDITIPSGKNFNKAEFRIWIPEIKTIKGVLVLVHGSNGDARPWVEKNGWGAIINRTKQNVSSTFWQDLAKRHDMALLGCYYTDNTHDQMFIEKYTKVDEGSGQALLDALKQFADKSNHPEISEAPLAFWGISAGGQFNYEFACWKPERVITFVLNKGGIYYTAMASKAAQRVPGVFFVGEKDTTFRNHIIKGIFSINRRAEAHWTLIEEPNTTHEFGKSLEISEKYYDEIIPLRLPESINAPLRTLNIEDGYIGDHESLIYVKYDKELANKKPTSWLPNRIIAETWKNSTTKYPL